MKLGTQEQPSSEYSLWPGPGPGAEEVDPAAVVVLPDSDPSVPASETSSELVVGDAVVVFEVLVGHGGEHMGDLQGHFGQGTPTREALSTLLGVWKSTSKV